jgi:hypothetical protein
MVKRVAIRIRQDEARFALDLGPVERERDLLPAVGH